MKFSHVGLTTNTPRKNEVYIEETKVWVTDYEDHKYKVEWLRYSVDSDVHYLIKEQPHIGYYVDNLEQASEGLECLLEPFEVFGGKRIGFYKTVDNVILELIEK